MERETLPDGVRFFDEKGSAILRRPAPHVEYLIASGYARAEAANHIIAQRKRILEECGKIALFDDLENLEGYDSTVRLKLTTWSRENRSKIVAFHILTRSRIVAMGVTVANLALGGSIRPHLDRRSFEEALEEQIGASPARR